MATPAQLAEKARQDRPRAPSPSTLSTPPIHRQAPPLPPRGRSPPAPPPYTEDDQNRRSALISEQWRSHDPRSSSTHSLVPAESARDGRRKLLLVFIHGFMGNETSFQSFPAHVHNLLTITLAETHVVHTKIYPRYKSRKAIEFARDDFSVWLEPLENDHTDIILLGHSMGGLLAAEVALLKPASPATGRPFRHRILGTISFDTPFLGMHPGVVLSGIGSLFRPAPEPPGKTRQASISTTETAPRPSLSPQQSASSANYSPSITESSNSSLVQTITSPLATPEPNDPFFNAPFPNDVRLPERKGWSSLFHFINKHSDGLTTATMEYFTSHLEFGGCLADYPGLKARYSKLRALDEVDDTPQPSTTLGYQPPKRRIRFLNYYTASTGRPKVPKVPPGFVADKDGRLMPMEVEMQDMEHRRSASHSRSGTPTPRISVEEVREGVVTPKELETDSSPIETRLQNHGLDSGDDEAELEMRHIDSMPIPDDEDDSNPNIKETSRSRSPSPSPIPTSPSLTSPSTASPSQPPLNLPPLPPIPTPPPPLDTTLYPNKDTLKLAEKDHKRLTKAYNQALKDRQSAIKDRQKLIDKHAKQREKALKEEEKQRLKAEKEAAKAQQAKEEKEKQSQENPAQAETLEHLNSHSSGISATSSSPSAPATTQSKAKDKDKTKPSKLKKDKKFCMLPPKQNGQRDECWVRVYMEGVDEVGAHCGLFGPGGEHYEGLVGDVGHSVGEWVQRAGEGGEGHVV